MRKRGNFEPLSIEILGDNYTEIKNSISKKSTRLSEYREVKSITKEIVSSEMYDKLYYFLSDISLF
jgi:hypothetical protein